MAAQQEPRRTEGTVVRVVGTDSVPVPGVRVVLHRIGKTVQGPVDSMVTDRAGRFRFRFRADTTAIYLASARHHEIEYFSAAIATNPAKPDTTVRVVVFDTSTTAPVAVTVRNLVVNRPAEDGTRRVLELLVLKTEGDHARVAPDTLTPSWAMPLPPGALGFEVGPGDLSPDAVLRRGDSLLVFAPLSPGEKQVVVEYGLPATAKELRIPFPGAVPTVNMLLEESDIRPTGVPFAPADSDMIQGRTYRRWSGKTDGPATVVLRLPNPRETAKWVLVGLVVAVALVIGGATAWMLGRRRVTGPVGPSMASPRTVDELITAIALVDERLAEGATALPADERARLVAERAALKAEAARTLGQGGVSRSTA